MAEYDRSEERGGPAMSVSNFQSVKRVSSSIDYFQSVKMDVQVV